MKFVVQKLKSYSFNESDVESAENFTSRDGFQWIEEKEFEEMMDYFAEFPEDFENSIPVMTDNQSNYICVYVKGDLKHQVWYLSHDELNTKPRFQNLTELITAINLHSDCWDFSDLADKLGINIYDL